MEYISVRRIMDRLLTNPNMNGLKVSQVAGYVKDLASILDMPPVLRVEFAYLETENYKVEVPANYLNVKKVFVCDDKYHLPDSLFEDNSLNAGITDSMIREATKVEYGEYIIRNNFLYTDVESIKVELKYECINIDDLGFPLLPYDGSLMLAVMNWVKYHHYTILSESGIVPDKLAEKAHHQYTWYIGQYTNKVEMPTEDEGVSIAHAWQRLVDTRNRSLRGKSLPQFALGNRRYKRRL